MTVTGSLSKKQQKKGKLIRQQNISKNILGQELPGYGLLNLFEWINFIDLQPALSRQNRIMLTLSALPFFNVDSIPINKNYSPRKVSEHKRYGPWPKPKNYRMKSEKQNEKMEKKIETKASQTALTKAMINNPTLRNKIVIISDAQLLKKKGSFKNSKEIQTSISLTSTKKASNENKCRDIVLKVDCLANIKESCKNIEKQSIQAPANNQKRIGKNKRNNKQNVKKSESNIEKKNDSLERFKQNCNFISMSKFASNLNFEMQLNALSNEAVYLKEMLKLQQSRNIKDKEIVKNKAEQPLDTAKKVEENQLIYRSRIPMSMAFSNAIKSKTKINDEKPETTKKAESVTEKTVVQIDTFRKFKPRCESRLPLSMSFADAIKSKPKKSEDKLKKCKLAETKVTKNVQPIENPAEKHVDYCSRVPISMAFFDAIKSKLEDKKNVEKIEITNESPKCLEPKIVESQFSKAKQDCVDIKNELSNKKDLKKTEFFSPQTVKLDSKVNELSKPYSSAIAKIENMIASKSIEVRKILSEQNKNQHSPINEIKKVPVNKVGEEKKNLKSLTVDNKPENVTQKKGKKNKFQKMKQKAEVSSASADTKTQSCMVCKKLAYCTERIICKTGVYHTLCFRCNKCNGLMQRGRYNIIKEKPFCDVCSKLMK